MFLVSLKREEPAEENVASGNQVITTQGGVSAVSF